MDAAQEVTAAWEITGARHGGITVSSLDRSLEFYCGLLGLELLWRRLFEEREIAEITGIHEATSFDIAMLQIPGSETQIELLEYHGCEPTSGAVRPCDYGSGHFCVFVREIDALHADLAAKGVGFRSDGPVEMGSGPNKGGKSLYSLDPDGYVFEFHQRPPHVAA